MKYKNHSSIIMISANISFELWFRFEDVSETIHTRGFKQEVKLERY